MQKAVLVATCAQCIWHSPFHLVVQRSKAVVMVPASAGAADLCAEVMLCFDIPTLPVCRNHHFSLSMGGFWSAARSTNTIHTQFVLLQKTSLDLEILEAGLWVL